MTTNSPTPSSADRHRRRHRKGSRDADEDFELRSIEEDDPLEAGVLVSTTKRKKKKKKQSSAGGGGDDMSSLGDSQDSDIFIVPAPSDTTAASAAHDGVMALRKKKSSSSIGKNKNKKKKKKASSSGNSIVSGTSSLQSSEDDGMSYMSLDASQDGIMVVVDTTTTMATATTTATTTTGRKTKKKKRVKSKSSSSHQAVTSLLDDPEAAKIGAFLQDKGRDDPNRAHNVVQENADNYDYNPSELVQLKREDEGIWNSARGAIAMRTSTKWYLRLRNDKRCWLAMMIIGIVAGISIIAASINRTFVVSTLAPSASPTVTATTAIVATTIAPDVPTKSPAPTPLDPFIGKICPSATPYGPLKCPYNEFCVLCPNVAQLYLCWIQPEPLNRAEFEDVCKATLEQGGRPCGGNLDCAFGDECVPCNSFAPLNGLKGAVCVAREDYNRQRRRRQQQQQRSLQGDIFDPPTGRPSVDQGERVTTNVPSVLTGDGTASVVPTVIPTTTTTAGPSVVPTKATIEHIFPTTPNPTPLPTPLPTRAPTLHPTLAGSAPTALEMCFVANRQGK